MAWRLTPPCSAQAVLGPAPGGEAARDLGALVSCDAAAGCAASMAAAVPPPGRSFY